MNFLENEHAAPIMLLGCQASIGKAYIIRRKTGLNMHLFAEEISFWQKLHFKCHKVCASKEIASILSLLNVADKLPEHKTPLLIYDGFWNEFVEKNIAILEETYIIIPLDQALQNIQKQRI